MKSGDIVTVTDSSWSKTIVRGEIVGGYALLSRKKRTLLSKKKHWTVLETGCSFPLDLRDRTPFPKQPAHFRNDTVIQGRETDDVVFIHHGFLKLVKKEHVWKHGDVYRRESGSVLIYLVIAGEPLTYFVYSPNHHINPLGTGDLFTTLSGATFLFNIADQVKDKL